MFETVRQHVYCRVCLVLMASLISWILLFFFAETFPSYVRNRWKTSVVISFSDIFVCLEKTLWPNWLKFFRSFKKISVYDRKKRGWIAFWRKRSENSACAEVAALTSCDITLLVGTSQAVRECIGVGASLLLPSVHERVSLLMAFLPRGKEGSQSLSMGQVSRFYGFRSRDLLFAYDVTRGWWSWSTPALCAHGVVHNVVNATQNSNENLKFSNHWVIKLTYSRSRVNPLGLCWSSGASFKAIPLLMVVNNTFCFWRKFDEVSDPLYVYLFWNFLHL